MLAVDGCDLPHRSGLMWQIVVLLSLSRRSLFEFSFSEKKMDFKEIIYRIKKTGIASGGTYVSLLRISVLRLEILLSFFFFFFFKMPWDPHVASCLLVEELATRIVSQLCDWVLLVSIDLILLNFD